MFVSPKGVQCNSYTGGNYEHFWLPNAHVLWIVTLFILCHILLFSCIIFILVLSSELLRAIIIIPNGVVSVSERTKPAIKIASFLPGFILMPAKR